MEKYNFHYYILREKNVIIVCCLVILDQLLYTYVEENCKVLSESSSAMLNTV